MQKKWAWYGKWQSKGVWGHKPHGRHSFCNPSNSVRNSVKLLLISDLLFAFTSCSVRVCNSTLHSWFSVWSLPTSRCFCSSSSLHHQQVLQRPSSPLARSFVYHIKLQRLLESFAFLCRHVKILLQSLIACKLSLFLDHKVLCIGNLQRSLASIISNTDRGSKYWRLGSPAAGKGPCWFSPASWIARPCSCSRQAITHRENQVTEGWNQSCWYSWSTSIDDYEQASHHVSIQKYRLHKNRGQRGRC